MENKLLNIIKYPIKLLLRKKVERCQAELVALNQRQRFIVPKSRRKGMTKTLFEHDIALMKLTIKYRSFINRWKLN